MEIRFRRWIRRPTAQHARGEAVGVVGRGPLIADLSSAILRCGFVGYGCEDDEWYFATDEDNVARSDAFQRWEALSSLEKQQRKKALDVEEAGACLSWISLYS